MRYLHTPTEAARWLRTQVQGVLHTDSRRVQWGDGFIAWPGGVTDGRRFVPQALQQGAAACLVEADGVDVLDPSAQSDGRVAAYHGLKQASGPIAAAYYERPSAELPVLAVTGTNGKTSTTWWLAHALHALGQRCALVGTLGVGEPGDLHYTGMTTPDPVLLQACLRDWADAGVQACAIEASSIGIAERRLDATQIRVAVFTNFTQDHLDYHGDMAAYWQAKASLFDWSGLQAAVINIDDPKGLSLVTHLAERPNLSVWTYSTRKMPMWKAAHHLQAFNLRQGEQGIQFNLYEEGEIHALDTALLGDYNISNLMAVLAVLRIQGHALADAVRVCAGLPAVPGRMQSVHAGDDHVAPWVVVDYAHTPDAVAHALQALRPFAQARAGELVCVLGCGGDRDPGKRPLMAAAAQAHADRVVLTSDNPRSEDPQAIVDQMGTGLTREAQIILDRGEAIATSIAQARDNDIVLIAGKGHEDHQEIAGVRHPFSDVAHARRAMRAWRVHA